MGGGSRGAARVPDSCLGWDCSSCDDSDVCGGSRRKGDGEWEQHGAASRARLCFVEDSLLVLAPLFLHGFNPRAAAAQGSGCVCLVYCHRTHLHVAGIAQP